MQTNPFKILILDGHPLHCRLQVSYQRSLRGSDQQDPLQKALQEQEAEIIDYQRELEATETQNRLLRHSMDRVKENADFTRCAQRVLLLCCCVADVENSFVNFVWLWLESEPIHAKKLRQRFSA